MESVSYKIKIRASINGVEKVPSKIAWIQGNDECLLTPCYKENDYLIVELIPGCVGNACIEGWLIFDDTCANCEPIYFKRCFCSTNADCEDCEECNEQGICQSKCLEGEYCLNDTCVECDPNNPCPNGKVCVNGRCVCPQGFFEKDGRCIQCDETTVLSKCQECRNGLIVEKPCDGACDPTTGECVGCLTGGDCFDRTDGKNCCNPDTKQCDCCPGTTWSTEQGKCIPILCTDDESCGDPCLKCTEDGCKPMLCPDGYKCWNGECVYWPCTSTSCENGADCGPECGCIEIDGIKQCVPCHILECLGMCEDALGCKCKENNVCGPVDNCGQYCDSDNPCTDPNCTCYNNQCVSCENFPCSPDDCSTRPNCGCTDGDCGGSACRDKLLLKTECGDNTNSCKLIANLQAEKGCKCDDIKFKTTILNSCTNAFNLLTLKTKLFKGLVEYSNFDHITIGDNELINGSIDVVVSHYDDTGTLITPTGLTAVSSQPINANQVAEIQLTSGTHYKVSRVLPSGEVRGNLIKIELKAKGIKIPNNDCINYKDGTVIASFEFNFLGNAASIPGNTISNCTKINTTYKEEQVKFLNDSVSSKKPLFIWSKTSTNFPSNKFPDTNEYTNAGWFRKVYGIKVSGGYKDEINSPDELLNNYIYQVKVDCGCTEKATSPVMDFCCLPEITPELTECNTKLSLDPFNICSVNGKITLPTVSEFNKAKYRVVIDQNGFLTTKEIEFNSNTSTKPFTFINPVKGPITAAKVERYFTGGILENKVCTKELTVNQVNLPDVIIEPNCDSATTFSVTAYQTSGSLLKIQSVRIISRGKSTENILGVLTFSSSDTSKTGTFNIDQQVAKGKLIAVVIFDANCLKEVELTPCPNDLVLTSNPDVFSKNTCPSPSTGPTLEIVPVGFGSDVQYSINGGAFSFNNSVANLAPGIYNVVAKEIVDGIEYFAESSIEILPAKDIKVTLNPVTICSGQSSTLTIEGESGVGITVYNPNNSVIATYTFTNNNPYVISSLNIAGEYRVVVTNGGNKFCTSIKTVILSIGGTQLQPQIVVASQAYCEGQPIPFRIFDGGINASYNVSSDYGVISPNPIQGSSSEFNGLYTPSVGITSGNIKVTGVADNCNTLIPTTQTVSNIILLPSITNITSTCVANSHTISATITGVDTVKIAGMVVTGVGNVYTKTGITSIGSVLIEASKNGCTKIEEVILQSCDCPTYSSEIVMSPATCGQGDQQLTFFSFSNNAIGKTYQLQKNTSGVWSNISGTNYSGILPTTPGAVPTINIPNQIGVEPEYRIVISDGTCNTNSNIVFTSAIPAPTLVARNTVTQTDNTSNGNTGVPYSFIAIGGTPLTEYTWSGAGVTGTSQTSNPITFNAPGTFVITVTGNTSGCITTATHTITIGQGCTNNVQASRIPSPNIPPCATNLQYFPTGGTGTLYYSVTGDLVIGQTTITGSSFQVPLGSLSPGVNNFTVSVYDGTGCPAWTDVVTHTKLACETINYIFIIDNSNSITLPEFTSMANQVRTLSQSIYDANNNSYFALAHYYSTNSSTHFLTIENVGQNLPITTITRQAGASDYLQESLNLFNISNFTGINNLLPTKIFIFTDAVGSIGGSSITDENTSWNIADEDDNVLPYIGANYIGGGGALDTYSVSDTLKGTYDIFVIRYPHEASSSGVELGPYANPQAVSDYMLTQVASPGKFFGADYNSNGAILDVLGDIDCSC